MDRFKRLILLSQYLQVRLTQLETLALVGDFLAATDYQTPGQVVDTMLGFFAARPDDRPDDPAEVASLKAAAYQLAGQAEAARVWDLAARALARDLLGRVGVTNVTTGGQPLTLAPALATLNA